MKALISPNETVKYVSAWEASDVDGIYNGVMLDISNGQRIVEVSETEFQVSDPLFWVDCNNAVNTNEYYYDASDSTIKLISSLEPSEPA